MTNDPAAPVCELFADLLDYPSPEISRRAQQCLALLQEASPDSARALEAFCAAIAAYPLERLRELYTITFDMQPVCYPYVGYQLFGESYKRGAFMAQLNETYRAVGYSSAQELPDHVSVILRFLGLDAADRRGDFCQALLNDGLRPALEKMRQAFGAPSENPYPDLLSAVHLFLAHVPEKELGHV